MGGVDRGAFGGGYRQLEQVVVMPAGPAITIGELEAKYPLYCKAMKLLLLEGRSPLQMQRTLCWKRLETLHSSLPRRYKSPAHLLLLLQRELAHRREAGAMEAV